MLLRAAAALSPAISRRASRRRRRFSAAAPRCHASFCCCLFQSQLRQMPFRMLLLVADAAMTPTAFRYAAQRRHERIRRRRSCQRGQRWLKRSAFRLLRSGKSVKRWRSAISFDTTLLHYFRQPLFSCTPDIFRQGYWPDANSRIFSLCHILPIRYADA